MNILKCMLVIMIVLFTNCQKLSPTEPEVKVPNKVGIYIGTYKKGITEDTIGIRIYNDGIVEIKNIIYGVIDIKSNENPITLTLDNNGYAIDFVKMTATSIAGSNKGYIYKLVKQ